MVRSVVSAAFGNRKMAAQARAILDVDFTEIETSLTRIKCYCISDLHADSEKNQAWVREKCVRRVEDSDAYTIIVLPGDVGSEIDRLESVFRTLTANYNAVMFVPGNHEAWRRGIAAGGSATIPEERAENRMAVDSIVKLQEVMNMAKVEGVYVGPLRVKISDSNVTNSHATSQGSLGQQSTENISLNTLDDRTKTNTPKSVLGGEGVVIFPLLSWYHSGWDKEPEITHPDYLDVEEAIPFARKWGDFSMCSWPDDIVMQEDFCSTVNDNTALAKAFAAVNEPFLPQPEPSTSIDNLVGSTLTNDLQELRSPLVNDGDTVISFSHFLPRQELCPEKRFLLEPLLAKVIGSDFLEEQIRRLKPDLHLFGHTHIGIDLELEGIRYVQWPKGYNKYVMCNNVYLFALDNIGYSVYLAFHFPVKLNMPFPRLIDTFE